MFGKVVETLANFCEETVDKLDIQECNNISNAVGCSDPVEIAIKKFENHPAVTVVTETLSFNARVEFRESTTVDTSHHEPLITKLHVYGFDIDFLMLLLSYSEHILETQGMRAVQINLG